MDKINFNKLLLKTAFSCMACDGHIDEKEVNLIKELGEDKKLFGEINIEGELKNLINEINQDGEKFLKLYIDEIEQTKMNDDEELIIIKTAIETINADEKLEYDEVKFFKIIRSNLNISNEKILSQIPDIEDYLEQDVITENYTDKIHLEYFKSIDTSKFANLKL
jgi:uncharacterized tellurite resistance protein B-like protein